MSTDQADRSAQQFEQTIPARSQSERSESARLHDQYKPVGIPAVSAAAQFTAKAKKTPQMS